MADQPRRMTPLKDRRKQRTWNKQTSRAASQDLHPPQGLPDPPLNTPGNRRHHDTPGRNGVRRRLSPRTSKETRQSIRLDILGPRPVRERKTEPIKEESPPGLQRAQPLGRTDIFKILMIRPDPEGLRRPLQKYAPSFPSSGDGREIAVRGPPQPGPQQRQPPQ